MAPSVIRLGVFAFISVVIKKKASLENTLLLEPSEGNLKKHYQLRCNCSVNKLIKITSKNDYK